MTVVQLKRESNPKNESKTRLIHCVTSVPVSFYDRFCTCFDYDQKNIVWFYEGRSGNFSSTIWSSTKMERLSTSCPDVIFFLQFGLYSSVRADDLSICSRYIERSLVKMLPCLGVQPSPYLGTSV